MQTDFFEVKVPNWAISYLIYDDESGMFEEEIKQSRTWLDKVKKECTENGGTFLHLDIGENSEFCPNPEFGLACDVSLSRVVFKVDTTQQLNL